MTRSWYGERWRRMWQAGRAILGATALLALLSSGGPAQAASPVTCGSPIHVCPSDRHCVTGVCVPN